MIDVSPSPAGGLEIGVSSAFGGIWSKTIRFSDGALHVSIPELPKLGHDDGGLTITARLQSPDDLIRLLHVNEIVRRHYPRAEVQLFVPFFPYARQDRVPEPDTKAFTLRPIAALINSLGFDRVVTCDPHSDVVPALVDRIEVIDQTALIAGSKAIDVVNGRGEDQTRYTVIVAPDAGASKKAAKVAKHFGMRLATAGKTRNPTTGEITGVELPNMPDTSRYLIVDDICDGGATFIGLADAIRRVCTRSPARGHLTIDLFVTHGIFSKGLGLFAGVIDHIYTTDSFYAELPYREDDDWDSMISRSTCRPPERIEF